MADRGEKKEEEKKKKWSFALAKTHFFLYLPRNKKHTLTWQGGTGCYRVVNYQPGS